jgi:aspartate/methionine/tyrosine aminotransferase
MLSAAARTALISPFYVMEIVKAAAQPRADGLPVIHMSIGEPDFTAPPPVQQAAQRAISAGLTAYTPALGLDSLRERIAAHYASQYGCAVAAERIVITAGASAALLLAMAALVNDGDEVLMPDPSYPCNRHFVTAFGGRAVLVPSGPSERFQLSSATVAAAWGARTRGVMLASPSNPTGTSILPADLAAVLAEVRRRGGFSVVDEIYQGLSYDQPPQSALALADDVVVINSFSKYFNMTGWRLGWLVVPPPLLPVVEKLAQNLFICASSIAQHAALACFDGEAMAIYEERRREFQRRRDYLVPALQRLGFDIPVVPDGAFYIYADVSRFTDDSWDFAFELLRETGVCVVPGRDFGVHAPQRYLRVSYATSRDRLEAAVERIAAFLARRARAAA